MTIRNCALPEIYNLLLCAAGYIRVAVKRYPLLAACNYARWVNSRVCGKSSKGAGDRCGVEEYARWRGYNVKLRLGKTRCNVVCKAAADGKDICAVVNCRLQGLVFYLCTKFHKQKEPNIGSVLSVSNVLLYSNLCNSALVATACLKWGCEPLLNNSKRGVVVDKTSREYKYVAVVVLAGDACNLWKPTE